MKNLLINFVRLLRCQTSKVIIALIIAALAGNVTLYTASAAEWSGVDETVVEKYAEQSGRPAWRPLINTDQGDLLLFVFLLAGVVGGFILGYYWRALFSDHKSVQTETQLQVEEKLDGTR